MPLRLKQFYDSAFQGNTGMFGELGVIGSSVADADGCANSVTRFVLDRSAKVTRAVRKLIEVCHRVVHVSQHVSYQTADNFVVYVGVLLPSLAQFFQKAQICFRHVV